VRGLDPVCDREAIRVVKKMPKWIPGKQNGIPVNVYYYLPITFKLHGTESNIPVPENEPAIVVVGYGPK
jgi:hypothetical protein